MDIDAKAIQRATSALVEACGQRLVNDDAGRASQFVAVLGDRLARNRESTFALAPCDQSRAAAFSGVLETHFPRDDARCVAAASIACVAFRDAPQLAKRGAAAQACLALAACVPGLQATAVHELFERARKAGLAPLRRPAAPLFSPARGERPGPCRGSTPTGRSSTRVARLRRGAARRQAAGERRRLAV